MKKCFHAFLLPLALTIGLGSAVGRATGQVFTTLFHFRQYYSDGSNPYAGVVLGGNVLYGIAKYDGNFHSGVVYAVNVDGSGFTNLHNFLGFPYEGGFPEAELILSDGVLYGTSREGTSSDGTVFRINADGSGFTTLHTFSASDGAVPSAGLVLSSNVLYGTTRNGGSHVSGTVFRLNTDGTSFTNLYCFSEIPWSSTNNDGANPTCALALSGNVLYGTTQNGGNWRNGTIFSIHTDGTGFTNLHSFSAPIGSYPFYTNWDGANPQAGLTLSGSVLYGTAQNGGTSGGGTVFAINTNGPSFRNLHSFTAAIGYTNQDGIFPMARLALSGNTLYGTANGGGSFALGTVFAVNTDGTSFTVLHSFSGIDGAGPIAGLIFSDTTLYGTTFGGGFGALGTVFSLALKPPKLNVLPSGVNVILTWPLSVVGFTLQSTTNLVPPMAWATVSPGPVVVNGQNAVTNTISGTRKFYRLSLGN